MTSVLLVTGGSRGIGAAVAALAAKRGYDVAVNYRQDERAASAIVEAVRSSGLRGLAIKADVAVEADVVRMFEAVDSFGQPLTTWTAYRTTRASIRLLSGQELYQGEEFTSAAQLRIRMRWTDNNTKPGHRILFGGRTYVVQICDNVMQRNRVLQLTCLEIDGTS